MNRITTAILITPLLYVACSDSSPSEPEPSAPPSRVLVLSDGGTEDHMLTVLDAAGMDTMRGGNWWEDIGSTLGDYDVVVLLNGEDYGYDMDESVQGALTQWVAEGGGLVVTEWFNYYQDDNPILGAIMPVTESDEYEYERETLRPANGHELSAALPDSFDTGPEWTWVTLEPDATASKEARVAVIGDEGGPAVVTGVYGDGVVVVWGMAGIYDGDDIWSPGVDQLLTSIVGWAGR